MSNSQLPADLTVVVGRQFGSGGRRIGRRLAARLGLTYYDKEVLSEAAQRFGFSQTIFARYDEKRPSAIRSFLSNAFGVPDSYMQNAMSCESIYAAQSRVISELADEGGCVFVGRSADYILRHRPNLISIFLHAPAETRARELLKRGEVSSLADGLERARRLDRRREEYYNYFTGRQWGKADNYHLSVDTSVMDDDSIIDLILQYIAARYKQ